MHLADISQYPRGLIERKELSGRYSHRIAPTSTPGLYLAAWVQGKEGKQDIYYRIFKK